MAITQNILNLDRYFNTISGDKVFVNDFNIINLEDKNMLLSKLRYLYNNTDVISTKPTCDCGELKGRYKLNRLCNTCGTLCRDPDEKVEPILWLKTIRPDIKFLNPTIWQIISKLLGKTGDWLRWLCDTRYNPNIPIPDHITYVFNNYLKGVRNYTLVVNNIREIIELISNLPKFKLQLKKKEIEGVIYMLDTYKDNLFSSYLPIINKKLFVIENTGKGKFVNIVATDIVNIVTLWSKISNKDKLTDREISTAYSTVMSDMSRLYNNYYNQYIVKKHGMLRKHAYGGRSHFTFRNVIISIPGKHKHDHIQVPYTIGVTVFRPHILNKLLRRGYSYKESNSLLFKAVKHKIPVITEILQELIDEAPNKRIPVISQRNPSLKQSSALMTYIDSFKEDIEDFTVTLSALVAKFPNADYDGDELNYSLLLDNKLAEEFKTLTPAFAVPDSNKPFDISGCLTLLSPGVNILTNYLADTTTENNKDTIVSKLKFVDVK